MFGNVAPGTPLIVTSTTIGVDPLIGQLNNRGGTGPPDDSILPFIRPSFNSPVIDAGDPHLQQGDAGLPEFDLRGAPFARVVGGRIDIGAYEEQPDKGSFLDADFDFDKDTDGSDFLNWQRNFGSITLPTKADGDATGNGTVDGNDLAVWEASYPSRRPRRSMRSTNLAAVASSVGNDSVLTPQLADLALAINSLDNRFDVSAIAPITADRTFAAEFIENTLTPFEFPTEPSRPRPPGQPMSKVLDADQAETPNDSLSVDQASDEIFAQL